MDEPHTAALAALKTAELNLGELARQREELKDRWRQAVNERHDWEARYQAAIVERDAARMERDIARAEAGSGNMSP